MAIIDLMNLEPEDMVGSLKGQKMMFYGDNDTGKTNQSMQMENPLLLMPESGGNAVSGRKQPIISWTDFKQVVTQLTPITEEKRKAIQEKYQTIIIDTVEALVNLCEQSVCKEYGVRDLSEMQSSKEEKMPNGYGIYRKDFMQQINRLTAFGYTVVFISHRESITKKDETSGKEYECFVPFGSEKEKSSTAFIRNLCDFVFYLKSNGIDNETQEALLSSAICKQTKTVFARSRYTTMPVHIPVFTAENLKKTILKAIEDKAKEENIGLKEYEIKFEGLTADNCKKIIEPYYKVLWKLYPDFVKSIVEKQLGEGKKVSEATDTQITELETIYKNLNSLANERGIVVED